MVRLWPLASGLWLRHVIGMVSRSDLVGAHAADPHHDLGAALDALRRIVRALGISARTAERSVGVTGAQLLVLQLLRDSPARSLNEVAEHTFTHQSTVSVVVDRLVTRGLVTRRRSTEDARRLVLTLTPAGHVALRRAPPPAQVQLIGALDALPTAARRALAQTLENDRGRHGSGRRAARHAVRRSPVPLPCPAAASPQPARQVTALKPGSAAAAALGMTSLTLHIFLQRLTDVY
jgi:DNA-binding MarR family transcriptional regulator